MRGRRAARITIPSISAYRNGVLIQPAALSARVGWWSSYIGQSHNAPLSLRGARIAILHCQRAARNCRSRHGRRLRSRNLELAAARAPARAVNGVTRRLADTGHAKARLGFETKISLEEGLRDLVAWWREEQGISRVAAE